MKTMLPHLFEQNINTPRKGNLSTIYQGYRMTESISQIVEQFLQHSDEKLEELSQKNRELKLEEKET